jgi:glycerol 2-dehydrogenase (NADP+)
VSHAIKVGYRHIDCAYVYGNETEVGEGIADGLKAAGIDRSELFVTTKLWCTYHTRIEENLHKSLDLLGLEHVDLYLMHWPVAMNANGNHEKFPKLPDGSRDLDRDRSHVDTYKEMQKLVSGGKVKAIGVCNYSKTYLEELLPNVEVVPAVNQIENHPLLPQQEIVDLCKEKGIVITAYSPLGSTGSPLMQDEHVVQLAKEKSCSPGCILLSYHGMWSPYVCTRLTHAVARGSSALAKSVTPSRIEENMKMVKLSPQDIASLDEISKGGLKRFVYRGFTTCLPRDDVNSVLQRSSVWILGFQTSNRIRTKSGVEAGVFWTCPKEVIMRRTVDTSGLIWQLQSRLTARTAASDRSKRSAVENPNPCRVALDHDGKRSMLTPITWSFLRLLHVEILLRDRRVGIALCSEVCLSCIANFPVCYEYSQTKDRSKAYV